MHTLHGGVTSVQRPLLVVFLNSVHLVPLLTRSCRPSKVLAGPRSGWKWSSAGYGSLRRSVATVWRFCGLASPTAVTPLKSTAPYTLPFGSFSVADGAGGVLSRARTPPSTCSLVVPYLWRPDAESRPRSFLKGLTLHWYPFAIWTSGSLLISSWVWSGK